MSLSREAQLASRDAPGGDFPAAVRRQLAKLLASRSFPANSRPAQFLSFVVEEALAGRTDGIKETSLAIQVFRRSSSFDPRIDSIVRVEAHHLRKRLRDYYASEGASDEIVFDLPVGSYVPSFVPRQSRLKPRRSWKSIAAVAVFLLGLAGAALWFLYANPPRRTVAVLPFKNLGGPENENLTLGLTEDLTTRLARLPQIRVTSRTSATEAQSRTGDIRQIGKLLSVGAVVEGSVWREAGRLRFNAQLIDTATGYHRWSEAFDRSAADPIQAEAEVTALIASAIARNLGADTPAAAAKAHTPHPEARRLFWEARHLRRQASTDSRAQATAVLERAVALDPAYLDAWAALASVSLTRTFHGEAPFDQTAAQTRAAASRTIELDPSNPDGLVALAQLEWLQDRNWSAAELRLRRAIELNPSSATARGWLATGLVTRGRFDEALRELSLASSISPISYVVSNDIATTLYCARRYDQAVRQARRTLEVNPQFTPARIVIGACHAAQRRYSDAMDEFQRVVEQGGRPLVLARLGNALARAGRREQALAILNEHLQASASREHTSVQTAMIHIGLGDSESALRHLEAAFAKHETDLNYVAVDPVFDPLRSDPRFLALNLRIGL